MTWACLCSVGWYCAQVAPFLFVNNWRLQLGVGAIPPAVMMVLLRLALPESKFFGSESEEKNPQALLEQPVRRAFKLGLVLSVIGWRSSSRSTCTLQCVDHTVCA